MTNLREFYEKEAERTRRYDSHSFWDSRYHQKRKKRLISLLKSFPHAEIFLDVGCGTGEYVVEASRFSAQPIGFDVSKKYLKGIKKLNARTQLVQADARSLPLKDKCADLVLCSETIEHLPCPNAAIEEISRVTKRTLVISTPNYGVMRILLSKVSKKSLENLDESVGHISVFSFSQLHELVKSKCKITSEEVLHVTPPIVGEMLHIPRKLELFVDVLEMSMEKLLPTSGNISIIVCEPS
jgi:ubiquinone/menaquinone biosynthesis C-methylase UbiE